MDIASLAPTLAPIIGGLAIGALIYALFGMRSTAPSAKERLSGVARKRQKMRENFTDKKKDKNGVNDSTLKVMRRTIQKFRMEELLENDDLKEQLALAGFRGRRAPVVFLFFQAVLPVTLAIGALLWFAVLSAAPFEAFRHSLICFLIMLAGYMAPKLYLSNIRTKRQKDMGRAYPDALDLMVICVEAGMSLEKSFHKVAEEITPQSRALGEEIGLMSAELSFIGDRTQAYENFSKRTGLQSVKALTSALVQAERYGTPMGQALRVLSDESRSERMSLAERKAASLPAKLTVPMIVFFLPVLFIVIIGPTILQVGDL